MNNEVAKSVFGGKVNVANLATLAAKAAESAQNTPRAGAPDGSEYMNFSGKRGTYTIGKDKREVGPAELWVVNVTSFEEGWVCWKGGNPASTRLSNIYTGVPVVTPDADELGPFDSRKGEGWFQAKAMVLRSCGEDSQQGYFKLNSVSGVAAIAEFIGEFAARAQAGEPCWPVVSLDVEEFEAQGYKNFKPVFNVMGWLSDDELERLAGGEPIEDILDLEEEEIAPPPPPTKRARRQV